MDPETRRTIQRILADQAAQTGASGDLGTLERMAPRERIPNFWAERRLGDVPQGNSEVLPANLWRYGLTPPQEWGEVGWDRDLTMERMLEGQGIEGWQNVAAQIGLGILEPGASEFGAVARAVGGLAAAVPRELLDALAKLEMGHNPLYRDLSYGSRGITMGTTPVPRLGYHGSPLVYGRIEPGTYGDWGSGLYWTYDADDASFYAPGRTKATRSAPNAAPNVRAFYPTGRYINVHDGQRTMPVNEAQDLVGKLDEWPIWREALQQGDGRAHDVQWRARAGQLTDYDLYRQIREIAHDHYMSEEYHQLWMERARRVDEFRARYAGMEDAESPSGDRLFDLEIESLDDWMEEQIRILPGRARNEVNDRLARLGYDGLWAGNEAVAFDPASTLIPYYDAPRIMNHLGEHLDPEDIERLRVVMDRWTEPVSGP